MKRIQKTPWRLASCVNRHVIPVYLRDWLLDAGSTTRRIYQIFGETQKVHLLQQAWKVPHGSEAQLLHIPLRTCALIREVELTCRKTVWMVARSVFPMETLTGKIGGRISHYLDERPLGQLLFREPHLKRSEFEITLLQPQHVEYQWAVANRLEISKELWARRSLFLLGEKPLLLTEVFFPDLFTSI